MRDARFEWDDDKARINLEKHKIDFEDAKLTFDDPGLLDEPDETMDYGEDRYRAVHAWACESILAGIREDLAAFGVEFDQWYSERSLADTGKISAALDRLRAHGHAQPAGHEDRLGRSGGFRGFAGFGRAGRAVGVHLGMPRAMRAGGGSDGPQHAPLLRRRLSGARRNLPVV